MKTVEEFLTAWQSEAETIEVHTSGSTGTPKALRVSKTMMRNSARMTCDFLGLTAADTALLCMPLRYIAGKMVVVRALEVGMRLIAVEPSRHPLRGLTECPTFAAMTPMQVSATLEVAEEAARLQQITHLIIGGGAIDAPLAARLKAFPNAVWSTYGMTETLSHIALRRLSGAGATDCYTPLPGVRVWRDERGCLAISAPHVCRETLYTNDIADVAPDGTFRILGRVDNVINSGGIKLQIEEIEAHLRPLLHQPFFITASADPMMGEAVTLLLEGEAPDDIAQRFQQLPPYERPRRIVTVPHLPYTETNKPDRHAARILAEECHEV